MIYNGMFSEKLYEWLEKTNKLIQKHEQTIELEKKRKEFNNSFTRMMNEAEDRHMKILT
jgi:hypothetical protein